MIGCRIDHKGSECKSKKAKQPHGRAQKQSDKHTQAARPSSHTGEREGKAASTQGQRAQKQSGQAATQANAKAKRQAAAFSHPSHSAHTISPMVAQKSKILKLNFAARLVPEQQSHAHVGTKKGCRFQAPWWPKPRSFGPIPNESIPARLNQSRKEKETRKRKKKKTHIQKPSSLGLAVDPLSIASYRAGGHRYPAKTSNLQPPLPPLSPLPTRSQPSRRVHNHCYGTSIHRVLHAATKQCLCSSTRAPIPHIPTQKKRKRKKTKETKPTTPTSSQTHHSPSQNHHHCPSCSSYGCTSSQRHQLLKKTPIATAIQRQNNQSRQVLEAKLLRQRGKTYAKQTPKGSGMHNYIPDIAKCSLKCFQF